jgi:hypothetical protein
MGADAGAAPSDFFGAGLSAFDVAGDAGVLLYGGYTLNVGSLEATWVLRDGSWTAVDPAPEPRHYFGMGFHAARQRVVVAGGWVTPGGGRVETRGTHTTMTWTPQGGWELADATLPEGLYGTAVAYDSKRQRLLLFAGNNGVDEPNNMLLAMNADSDAWVPVDNVSPPAPRLFHTLVYDSARDVLVLFGGTVLTTVPDGDGGTKPKFLQMDDTWEYRAEPSPGSWTRVGTAGDTPPPRFAHAMTFDPRRARVVLFGGSDPGKNQDAPISNHLDDTWEFDGDCWQPIATDVHPDNRYRIAMTYDPSSRSAVLAGGRSGAAVEDPIAWRYVGLGSDCSALLGCEAESLGSAALCYQGVCCEKPCGGQQQCNLPGSEGTCTDP